MMCMFLSLNTWQKYVLFPFTPNLILWEGYQFLANPYHRHNVSPLPVTVQPWKKPPPKKDLVLGAALWNQIQPSVTPSSNYFKQSFSKNKAPNQSASTKKREREVISCKPATRGVIKMFWVYIWGVWISSIFVIKSTVSAFQIHIL